MHNDLLATALALSSALSIALGTVLRHQMAEKLPANSGTVSGVFQTLRRPQWWVGVVLALVGYGLQIVALAFGTLLLVQPLLVMSLMFTLPLAAKFNHRRISKGETFWAIILTVAVATLVGIGRPLPGDPSISLGLWIPNLAVGVLIFGLMYYSALTFWKSQKALILGSCTGWLYGYVAVLSKAVMDIYTRLGLRELAVSWELWLLVAIALFGVGVQQAAFNAGALQKSLPAMTIVEPIVAFALGYIILGERFQATGWLWGVMGLALVAMILSTIVLSQRPVAGAESKKHVDLKEVDALDRGAA